MSKTREDFLQEWFPDQEEIIAAAMVVTESQDPERLSEVLATCNILMDNMRCRLGIEPLNKEIRVQEAIPQAEAMRDMIINNLQ